MAKQQLVLAFFASEAVADDAVTDLKDWDFVNEEIKLGAIGVLAKDEKGKIKTQKLGKRKTKTGVIVGVLAGILSGGVTVLGGALVGGVLGAFFREGLGLSKDDLARLDRELDGGKAAVCVLVDPEEAAAVAARLAELGGKTETHEVTEEAVQEAETAAEEMPEEAVELSAKEEAPEPASV